mmetsp:Transcript_31002/g.44537  ORF Transcript_31002/g.44537 Transcript_31002/m.44537 type:complete len:350 (-) Transcript_31002:71-1120(-)
MMLVLKFILFTLLTKIRWSESANIVINTWAGPFLDAASSGYRALSDGLSALDAVEIGCSTCEDDQCDGTVGFGNGPDSLGFTTLDALIMDGNTMNAGSVAYIQRYRKAISLARQVMTYSDHTLLVGDGAEKFAEMIGILQPQLTTTIKTRELYQSWKTSNCQPNFYRNLDGVDEHCPPYNISTSKSNFHKNQNELHRMWASSKNHDTIGMVVLTNNNEMACGTSTNGANHKVAGRVGDAPIVGSGCYVNSKYGGAAATGDGDIMMRFSPAFLAVTLMGQGVSPSQACLAAMNPIAESFPSFSGALVCLDRNGSHGAAAHNMPYFSYSMSSDETNGEAVPLPAIYTNSVV